SGQREQTVNLPALPSEVRILPGPPRRARRARRSHVPGAGRGGADPVAARRPDHRDRRAEGGEDRCQPGRRGDHPAGERALQEREPGGDDRAGGVGGGERDRQDELGRAATTPGTGGVVSGTAVTGGSRGRWARPDDAGRRAGAAIGDAPEPLSGCPGPGSGSVVDRRPGRVAGGAAGGCGAARRQPSTSTGEPAVRDVESSTGVSVGRGAETSTRTRPSRT